MIPEDFDIARSRVRDATYPNATVERDTIHAVDAQVFEEVREYEARPVTGGHALVETAQVEARDAEALAGLRASITAPLERATLTETSTDLAKVVDRFNVLSAEAERALAALDRVEAAAVWSAEKLRDP